MGFQFLFFPIFSLFLFRAVSLPRQTCSLSALTSLLFYLLSPSRSFSPIPLSPIFFPFCNSFPCSSLHPYSWPSPLFSPPFTSHIFPPPPLLFLLFFPFLGLLLLLHYPLTLILLPASTISPVFFLLLFLLLRLLASSFPPPHPHFFSSFSLCFSFFSPRLPQSPSPPLFPPTLYTLIFHLPCSSSP